VSFLIDGPLLYAGGAAYASAAPEGLQNEHARPPAAAILAVFYFVSFGLYLNARWTEPLWRSFGARDGRDFMINSGLLRLESRRNGPSAHGLAALAFATYPLWLWRGYRRGRRRRLARP
jgi:membrane-associated phospholipid phosphatase